jgi:EAL and modified HD-GYP domain-containing signal transduction protein
VAINPSSDVFVARQPIFDRRFKLVGYQLLYRTTARAAAGPPGSQSSPVAALLSFGLETLTGGSRAFVPLSHDLLTSAELDELAPDRWTVELSAKQAADADTMAAASVLRTKGFTVALDDLPAGDDASPLLDVAQIVKIDVAGRSKDAIAAAIAPLKLRKIELLADKVDSAESHTTCMDLGFSYFQGLYFSRPEIVRRRELPVGMVAVARLMNLVADPNTHERKLEEAFRADPGLSFKLLQIANSAAFGTSGIATIGQAIRLVGREPLHRWLAALFVSSSPQKTGVDSELVLTALQRGWLCEKMAMNSGRAGQASSLFLAGLLSNFDAILGITIPDLLRRVHVSEEVTAALLGKEGPLTPYVEVAKAFVQGDFDKVEELASLMGVLDELPGWFAEASTWARGMLKLG